MLESDPFSASPRVWQVGALCRAIAEALETRFNPVSVRGEVSGFARASSGHCYLSLKDGSGQIRCAMFRRAASSLDFSPRDGELVEVRGRLGVYEPRGDLQLIVDSMSRVGQGALFEQFLQLKAKLEAEGLFDPGRKRALPIMPRGIGVVTSLGAAALHDVLVALHRRLPHVPVVVAPAAVQGAGAPQELRHALSNLYGLTSPGRDRVTGASRKGRRTASEPAPVVDVILLVRGGGSLEDLWAFNDEQLVRSLVQSPVPVVCGVGHETDFTLADFAADLRAPTPTAAAEMVAQPRERWQDVMDALHHRLRDGTLRHVDRCNQQLDLLGSRLVRPSALMARQHARLMASAQRLQFAVLASLTRRRQQLERLQALAPQAMQRGLQRRDERLQRVALRLGLLDPTLVLRRGYAWLADSDGKTISSVRQTRSGQMIRATLADGEVDLTVAGSI